MDFSKLNKEQIIAVEHKKGPLLVLSGAVQVKQGY